MARNTPKTLRMAHEKHLMCETNLHRCGHLCIRIIKYDYGQIGFTL